MAAHSNPQFTTAQAPRPTLLAVTYCTAHLALLRGIFSNRRWRFEIARTCRDAISSIRRLRPCVVLCERQLLDGDWRDLLRELEAEGSGSRLIVASRLADDAFWAEVLNLGGYDVVTEPFDIEEVRRVIDNCHPEPACPLEDGAPPPRRPVSSTPYHWEAPPGR